MGVRVNTIVDLSDEQIIQYENTYGADHYGRVELVVHKWKGVWLYDRDGNKYLDCLAAYSAANQGHHHPKIVKAAVSALKGNRFSVISNVPYTPSLATFTRDIARLVPLLGPRCKGDKNKVLLKNGGVESVETAVKLGRDYGYRQKGLRDGEQKIICFRNNFHGRTSMVVSFSSTEKYSRGFCGRDDKHFPLADFGDLDSVKKAIDSNTCAILVEPMQGEGGMNVPPAGFIKGLRELADEYGLLLIFDEIQVGLGRTGRMFCFEHEGIVPDVLIIGKALSGGLVPISACVTNSALMDMTFQPGRDGSTFGGYPGACHIGTAALRVLQEERLAENSARMGELLKARIEEIASRSPHVKEVRGRGLFIGIEVKNGDAMHFCRQLLRLGMLVNDSHGHTIRISPPLIINEKHVKYIAERLEKVLI